MAKKESVIPAEVIENKIYLIRRQKVMLDKDLAELYEVTTKALKQAVKRNIKRFPSDFMFELSSEEFSNLRSQFVTSKSSQWGGTRYAPMAFTEQGVAMLSSVLNSERAIEANIPPCVRIVVTCKKKDSPGSLTPGVPGSETARGDENPGAYRRQKCYMRKPLKKQWYRSCYYPAVQAC